MYNINIYYKCIYYYISTVVVQKCSVAREHNKHAHVINQIHIVITVTSDDPRHVRMNS